MGPVGGKQAAEGVDLVPVLVVFVGERILAPEVQAAFVSGRSGGCRLHGRGRRPVHRKRGRREAAGVGSHRAGHDQATAFRAVGDEQRQRMMDQLRILRLRGQARLGEGGVKAFGGVGRGGGQHGQAEREFGGGGGLLGIEHREARRGRDCLRLHPCRSWGPGALAQEILEEPP